MPGWMHLTLARLGSLVSGNKLDAELQEEIDQHLDLLTEQYRAEGFSPAEARRKALIKLGGVTATRELHRDTRGLPSIESFFQDVRYAFRGFVREPGYFAVAVLIIGLGVGAASSIFSVVNTLVLKPLPFPDADRLVWITKQGDGGLSSTTLRTGNLGDWREMAESFEDLGGYFAFFDYTNINLYGEGQSERIRAAAITEGFLSTLAVTPQLGRGFVEAETVSNGRPAVLLTDGYWRRRFGADPDVIGQTLNLSGFVTSGAGSVIVGVLPRSFDFAAVFRPGTEFDVFIPFPISERTHGFGNTLEVVGRLKPDATIETAQGELDRINEQLRIAQPDRWGIAGLISPLQEHVNGQFRPALFLLAGAVGLLLLIACTNLSNLLLARASSRQKEIALRSALGAGRMRIIRQMLTESMLLAVCGSILGIGLAYLATGVVSSLSVLNIPLLSSVVVDQSVLIFSIVVAVLCGLTFGLLPALQVSVSHEASALKESGRGSSDGKERTWLRGSLVVAETALACVLLIGAGLLLRSFWTLLEVNPGYRPELTAAWQIDPQRSAQPDIPARIAYLNGLARAVEAVPGVVAVGLSDSLPLGANRSWSVGAKGVVYAEGETPDGYPRLVDANYVSSMGIPLISGRGFTPQDDADGEQVALVNQSMATTLWPGQDPIGQVVVVSGGERVVRGVVGDVRHSSLEEESGLEVYIPIAQTNWSGQMQMVVRTNLSFDALAPAVSQVLNQEDPLLPTNTFQVLSETVDRSLSPRRFTLWLIGAFSLAALALASLGIYGVVSYSVSQRTQEIGIRMALGAQVGRVRSQIVGHTLRLALVGIGIGIVASLFLARTITSLLYGVSSSDPWTFGVMAIVLLLVAASAGYVPAHRISRADLATVLRSA